MRRIVAVFTAVAALAVPAAASAHMRDWNGGSANSTGPHIACWQARNVVIWNMNYSGYHGGHLRSDCQSLNTSSYYDPADGGVRWRLGVRAVDGSLLWADVDVYWNWYYGWVWYHSTWHQ